MARSSAKTVAAYLKELPPERRAVVSAVRDVVLKNLPAGYEESMLWGTIAYGVPLSRLSDTYNKQPLCYAALAAQKNNYTLYLMTVYGGDAAAAKKFRDDYRKSGKRLDMGKSCVHFKSLDDLPLDLIARAIAAVPMEKWIKLYHDSRAKMAARTPAERKKAAAKRKATAKR